MPATNENAMANTIVYKKSLRYYANYNTNNHLRNLFSGNDDNLDDDAINLNINQNVIHILYHTHINNEQ